jgi:hypothetical protein
VSDHCHSLSRIDAATEESQVRLDGYVESPPPVDEVLTSMFYLLDAIGSLRLVVVIFLL